MGLTERQRHVLTNLSSLEVRLRKDGRSAYSLDGKDVTTIVHALMVKEVVRRPGNERRLVLTETGGAQSIAITA